MPRTWNNGMLILKERYSFINFVVKSEFCPYLNIPFPQTHYSIIPLFQHSNWGEAPKFVSYIEDFSVCLVKNEVLVIISKNVVLPKPSDCFASLKMAKVEFKGIQLYWKA